MKLPPTAARVLVSQQPFALPAEKPNYLCQRHHSSEAKPGGSLTRRPPGAECPPPGHDGPQQQAHGTPGTECCDECFIRLIKQEQQGSWWQHIQCQYHLGCPGMASPLG